MYKMQTDLSSQVIRIHQDAGDDWTPTTIKHTSLPITIISP